MNNEAGPSLKDTHPEELPLSVLLFYTAMCKNVSLSDFAKNLGVGALSLRQFISGQAQRPRGRTLGLLAKALNLPVDEVRQRTTLRPVSAPRFNDWIKEKMADQFSRAKLTRETRISDGALRNYLSGQTLPDSDQAQRLAETLNIDPLELAKVIIADHLVRSGGETLPAPSYMSSGAFSVIGIAASGDVDMNEQDHPRHSATGNIIQSASEEHVLILWRKLHPQGRRATLNYIAALLAEE
jgi:transcriptional regulator with XRE-family HTH domain